MLYTLKILSTKFSLSDLIRENRVCHKYNDPLGKILFLPKKRATGKAMKIENGKLYNHSYPVEIQRQTSLSIRILNEVLRSRWTING